MGRDARIVKIDNSTDDLHPSEFWCQIFKGDHISVDFQNKEAKLVVLGERNPRSSIYKWTKWSKIDKEVEFPKILEDLVGNYEWINCEFIGDKLIEVHFRQNSDFRFGNTVAIPLWKGEKVQNLENYEYVEDPDYLRQGFYIDKDENLLREVVGDHVHDLKRQTVLHEEIRNDEDYDDWEYGTEPSYGKPNK
jgi:hypothetical protein